MAEVFSSVAAAVGLGHVLFLIVNGLNSVIDAPGDRQHAYERLNALQGVVDHWKQITLRHGNLSAVVLINQRIEVIENDIAALRTALNLDCSGCSRLPPLKIWIRTILDRKRVDKIRARLDESRKDLQKSLSVTQLAYVITSPVLY